VCPWQNIKQGIEGHAVDWYGDVFDLIFPNVNVEAANTVWDKQLKEPEKEKKKRKSKSSKPSEDEDSSDDD
jgi:ATP-dependent Lon protease